MTGGCTRGASVPAAFPVRMVARALKVTQCSSGTQRRARAPIIRYEGRCAAGRTVPAPVRRWQPAACALCRWHVQPQGRGHNWSATWSATRRATRHTIYDTARDVTWHAVRCVMGCRLGGRRTSLARTRIPATPISGAAGPLPIDGHLPASNYRRMPSSPAHHCSGAARKAGESPFGPASCSKCAATNGAADGVLDGRIEAVRVVERREDGLHTKWQG